MIPSLIIFGLAYLAITFTIIDETAAALMGAMAVIGFHLVPYKVAIASLDINVVFLLVGMMIIMNIIADTGVLEWLAITIAQFAKGNGIAIALLMLATTAFVSAFLDNVTTVLLIAPITILLTQLLEIPTVPILVMEAVFSNMGGTATLIGDPPNILIGSRAGLSFNDFIINLTPIILIACAACLVIVYFFFGKSLSTTPDTRQRVMTAQPRLAIVDPPRLWGSMIILLLVIIGFFFSRFIEVEAGVIALSGAVLMLVICKVNVRSAVERIEWNAILFFIGLFIMVGALEYNGFFEKVGNEIVRLTKGNMFLTAMVILWMGAIVSAIVNNVPLVMAMLPLIESMVPAFADQMGIANDPEKIRLMISEPLIWCLALGTCLGGNGTLVGASANVVVAQIAVKNKCPISFIQFTRIGFPTMIFSIALCSIYVWLRYF